MSNWCVRCFASDEEAAAKGCKNPMWHLPNFNGEVEFVDESDNNESEGTE